MDDTYLWSHDRDHLQRTLAELEVRLARDGLYIHPAKTTILYSEPTGGGDFRIGGATVPCQPFGTVITALGSPLTFQEPVAAITTAMNERAKKTFNLTSTPAPVRAHPHQGAAPHAHHHGQECGPRGATVEYIPARTDVGTIWTHGPIQGRGGRHAPLEEPTLVEAAASHPPNHGRCPPRTKIQRQRRPRATDRCSVTEAPGDLCSHPRCPLGRRASRPASTTSPQTRRGGAGGPPRHMRPHDGATTTTTTTTTTTPTDALTAPRETKKKTEERHAVHTGRGNQDTALRPHVRQPRLQQSQLEEHSA